MNTQPLSVLSEDEEIFRKTIREFSSQEITPRVAQMESEGCYAPELIPKLFELGIMAIETPEKWGGADGSFCLSVLAVEEVSRADASVGVLVDLQNTLVANAVLSWGSESLK